MIKSRHKKHTKPSVFHRLRFMPAFLLIGATLILQSSPVNHHSGRSGVLSYAISVSASDLLSQTNSQRSANGAGNLSINNQLSSAAQAKANDMVARNYWAHVTPDGEQPWAFMDRAGYTYITAGENLAYGFENSADTVTGWMNSPAHRDNLLNTAFKDVGFGFANSADFVNTGEQTIVVAMYGAQNAEPVVLSSNNTPTAPVQTTPEVVPNAVAAESQPIQTAPSEAPVTTAADNSTPAPVAKIAPVITTAKPVAVRRIQLITNGKAAWSSSLMAISISGLGVLWAIKRGIHIKRLILAGESFIIHHVHIDLAVLGFIALGLTLLQTNGIIR